MFDFLLWITVILLVLHKSREGKETEIIPAYGCGKHWHPLLNPRSRLQKKTRVQNSKKDVTN